MRSKRFILAGVGEILWDLLPTGRKLGGAPANFAYHAHALGAVGVPASCVGDDEDGREIVRHLQGLGIDTGHISVDPEHHTGTVTVKMLNDGGHQFIIHENVAWDYIRASDKLLELARKADAVCFGSLAQRCEASRDAIRGFVGATGKDAYRIFDINLRQSYYCAEVIDASLKLCNVFKINDEELPVLSRLLKIPVDEKTAARELIWLYGLKLVAVTKGGRGTALYSPQGSSEHPGYKVKVADTVGAGDSFTAAMTLGLLKDFDLEKINDCANRVSSFVCTQSGATPDIPDELKGLFN